MPFLLPANCTAPGHAAFSVVCDHIGTTWDPKSLPNILLMRLSVLCKCMDKATYSLLRRRAIVFNPHANRFYPYYLDNMKAHRQHLLYLLSLWMQAGGKKITVSYPTLRGANEDVSAYTIVDSAQKTLGYLQVVRVGGFGLKLRIFNFNTNEGTHVKVENGTNYVLYRKALDSEVTFYPTHDTDGCYVAVDDGKRAIYRLSGAAFAAKAKALLEGVMYPLAQIE
jgi:hypothetical protein